MINKKEAFSGRHIRDYPVSLRLELKELAARKSKITGKYTSLQALEIEILKAGAIRVRKELDSSS